MQNLIETKLLTKSQRLITIFLLIECFKSEGIKKNPFAQTLINICDKPVEQYQTKMICQIAFENKREKYVKCKMNVLLEQQQMYRETYKPREQLQKFKKIYKESLPKIFTNIRNVILDVTEKKNIVIPQIPCNKDSIREEEVGCDNFSANFLRPLPKFLEINPNELIWASPGMICDVMWDSTAQKQRCLVRIKFLLKKVEKQQITQEQIKQVIKTLDDNPYLIHTIDLPPNNFFQITLKNPCLATQIFSRLNKSSKKIQQYSQKLITGKLTTNSIDTMSRIIKRCQLHPIFLKVYIIQTMKKTYELESTERDKISKLLSKLLKIFLRQALIDIKDKQILNELKKFIISYPRTHEDNLIQYLSENQ